MAELFSPPGDPEPRIGAELRAARKRAGLTGAELAARAGMSQAKISRLERGLFRTDPADAETLGGAMGLPPAQIAALVALAHRERERMNDWRSEPGRLPDRQEEIAELERASNEIRVFNGALVPGLLQTSGYAQRALGTWLRAGREAVERPETGAEMLATVSRRIGRQEILADPRRSFHFVITESVLGNWLGTAEDMLSQIQRLRELTGLRNVRFGIIPSRSRLIDAPLHSFELLDDRWVMVDLYNTAMTSQGPADTRLYREIFDRMQQAAVADVDAVLREYTDFYRGVLGD